MFAAAVGTKATEQADRHGCKPSARPGEADRIAFTSLVTVAKETRSIDPAPSPSHRRLFRPDVQQGKKIMEEEDDILSDLSYVAENFDDVGKETIILVLEAAIAEIIGLRITVQTAASKAKWAPD
ncbi:hypothetical protein NKH99_00615 [Mesorhizobium sp. M0854]|uniref:hypothetical protein n=1 Tax=unclassified Mesorhizobium TaxID=325217 RepID=UPI0033355258